MFHGDTFLLDHKAISCESSRDNLLEFFGTISFGSQWAKSHELIGVTRLN